jgi:alpha-glucosidase
MNKYLLSAIFVFGIVSGRAADTLNVCSPSGNICVKIWKSEKLMYQVDHTGHTIILPSQIDMIVQGKGSVAVNNPIRSSFIKRVRDTIIVPVPEKRKKMYDNYNELSISFRKAFQLKFRVYDDAVAYRIITSFKDSIIVENEQEEFRFPGEPSAYLGIVQKRSNADIFHTSFEELYTLTKIQDFSKDSIAFSPVLINTDPKIAITESDLEDYPGMFLAGTGTSALTGKFAGYPLEEKVDSALYSQALVSKRAGYIAKTKGARNFPWRVIIIAENDRDLPSNDIVYKLAAPSRVKDVSWIKPGNITDEWIIDVNLFNVPFKTGRNTDTYKYYIDFAKRFGFTHIMLDAGWSDNNDLFAITPDINMDTLVAYAKLKGVKLAMWTLALTLDRQLDKVLDQFNKWGVDFIMTDFMDRDDQEMVRFHTRIAEACAAHKIMIMFHGTYPPKGFNRTYPNAVTREAVLGSEYNIWSEKVTPDHDLILPFTRMLAGSFDYEPGSLNNASKNNFRPIGALVMSQGTRCHQLAMTIIYDNPMQFFSGNPSQAWLEPRYTEMLGCIPTTWDETRIVDARVGQYIITARRKDNDWYIGGMTNWTERDIAIDFSFINNAKQKALICKDGVNADKYGSDYVQETIDIKKNETIKLHMAPGGGFFIHIHSADKTN